MCIPATLGAQAVSVSGRVLRGGRDTVPLPNAWVVLHRVTRDGGGPVDSVRSDARGRYRILLRQPDSTGVYVVSAWYDSLAYFSLPLNVVGRPAAHVEDLVAFPTSTSGPPLRLARRLATVAQAHEDGTREVLEILEIENPGVTTRITRDTLVPTWAGRVPGDAGQFRGGQGDISPDAMIFRNDSVYVLGPIPPGPVKQLSYGYSLAAGVRTLAIPIDQPTTELNLLVEDTAAAVSAPQLESLGVQEIEQRRFAAYRAGPLAAGDRVEIQLPSTGFRAQTLLPVVIAVLAGSMVIALVWALRRKPVRGA
ncbi:MAG TPA: hypothetical protein VFM23_07035 [Gemmatimonadales bacterium]|nr:hypothetical protein [Gemmatimonadales bacterium]